MNENVAPNNCRQSDPASSDKRSKAASGAAFARLLDLRTIVLGSEIDDGTASRLAPQLLLLSRGDPRADIRLYIDSTGGSPSSALAIHDAMDFVSCDVSTWALGRVASVANLILCSGAKGKRYATSTSSMSLDCSADLQRYPDPASGERWLAEVARLMARLTGQSMDRIATDLRAGPTLNAVEARAYGLIDEVVDTAPGGPQSN